MRCLNVLKIWQLNSQRGSDLREIKAEMIMSFISWTQKLSVMTYTALCWWSNSHCTEEGCRKETATQQASTAPSIEQLPYLINQMLLPGPWNWGVTIRYHSSAQMLNWDSTNDHILDQERPSYVPNCVYYCFSIFKILFILFYFPTPQFWDNAPYLSLVLFLIYFLVSSLACIVWNQEP